MITGIQITKAANDDLLNSFWLLDSEKGEARCLCAQKNPFHCLSSFPACPT